MQTPSSPGEKVQSQGWMDTRTPAAPSCLSQRGRLAKPHRKGTRAGGDSLQPGPRSGPSTPPPHPPPPRSLGHSHPDLCGEGMCYTGTPGKCNRRSDIYLRLSPASRGAGSAASLWKLSRWTRRLPVGCAVRVCLSSKSKSAEENASLGAGSAGPGGWAWGGEVGRDGVSVTASFRPGAGGTCALQRGSEDPPVGHQKRGPQPGLQEQVSGNRVSLRQILEMGFLFP